MITEARRDCVDTDSVDPAFADAVYITKLNKYYYMWYEKMEKRIKTQTATQNGLTLTIGVTGANATPTNYFEIVRVMRGASASAVLGVPIEIRPLANILRLQDSTPTPQAAPTM